MSGRSFLQALGPGLLFAAAAVGVSHLVQATRAGAIYGLSFVALVVVANIVKYPAFRFGPHYAATTGQSLLTGYRRQGRWALTLYALVTLATMFVVQAAVTVVTAGLAIATLGLSASPLTVSAGLLVVCSALLAVGHYRLLDRLTKVLVAVLTLATLIATAAALPRVEWQTLVSMPPLEDKTLFFAAAVVGWMPSAIDVSVWQSLWTIARREDAGHKPSLKESMVDFHIGYVGTAVLALCFLTMGAGIMHGSGAEFSDGAAGFAAQVIELYTESLGRWIAPVVGTAAFAVMFSTTLTVLDGFPRAIATLVPHFEVSRTSSAPEQASQRAYWLGVVGLGIGALTIIGTLMSSLRTMVDVATTLSFLTAPILSVLNHRAILGPEVPADGRPRRWLVCFSAAGILFQAAFALGYLALRYL